MSKNSPRGIVMSLKVKRMKLVRVEREFTPSLRSFLDEYKALCRKHGCLILSYGESVQAAEDEKLANKPDPWNVEEKTREGWVWVWEEEPPSEGE